MAGIFDPVHLLAELDKTHQSIRVVHLVVDGERPYPQPVPDLQALERYERELRQRLSTIPFPSLQLRN